MTSLVKSPLDKDGGICSILFLYVCIFRQQEMGPSPQTQGGCIRGDASEAAQPAPTLMSSFGGEMQIPTGFSNLGHKKNLCCFLGKVMASGQDPAGLRRACGWQEGDDYEPPLPGDRQGWTHLNINHLCKQLGKSRVAGAAQGP